MNYASIKEYDVANGRGVRLSLFVSGCPHHCKNCFNEEAWDYKFGKPFTEEVENEIIKKLKNRVVYDGLSLLGGEPFALENASTVLQFIKKVKKEIPDIDIWAYSGYLLDELVKNDTTYSIIKEISHLVDGKFIEKYKKAGLKFRGSSNQRLFIFDNADKETMNFIVLNTPDGEKKYFYE